MQKVITLTFMFKKWIVKVFFYTINTSLGAGNSSIITTYFYEDYRPESRLNYYRIVQVDFDGTETVFSPKSVDNRVDAKEIKNRYNLLGQLIDDTFEGIVIVLYKDGTSEKKYQTIP